MRNRAEYKRKVMRVKSSVTKKKKMQNKWNEKLDDETKRKIKGNKLIRIYHIGLT